MTFDREGPADRRRLAQRTVWRIEQDGSLHHARDTLRGQEAQQPERHRRELRRLDLLVTDPPGGLVILGMVGADLQRHLDMQAGVPALAATAR